MTVRIDRLAALLRRGGLAAPARVLLEAHRPLLPFLRQAGIALSPIVDPILGRRGGTEALIDDPDAMDRLLAELAGPTPEGD